MGSCQDHPVAHGKHDPPESQLADATRDAIRGGLHILGGMVELVAGVTKMFAVAVLKVASVAESAVGTPQKDHEKHESVVGLVAPTSRAGMDEEMKEAAEEAAREAIKEAAVADVLDQDAVEKAVEAVALEEAAEELMAEAVIEEAMAKELGKEAGKDTEAAVVIEELVEEDDA
jgi:hypothetical protein